MSLIKQIQNLKPIRGTRLVDWLKRFLTAPMEDLSNWKGTFTEVMTAKVVSILLKRGVIEELECREQTFSKVMNAMHRAKPQADEE